MKKVLIVLCCVSLLLPAAALSAFAVDGFSISYTNSYGYTSCKFYLNGSLANVSSFPVSCVAGDIFRILYDDDGDGADISLNGAPFVHLGEDRYFDFVIVGDVVIDADYNVFEITMVAPPSPVSDGVDSSISYTGQVLHFLATNTTTIVLIGLSVAMFAVLPFAISKIKQIIKGY